MRILTALLTVILLVNISTSLLAQQGDWRTSGQIYGLTYYVDGHVAATSNNPEGFVQLWRDNAIIWRYGNINSQGLRFGSATDLEAGSWTERMRIKDNGFVGIGTSNPQAPLSLGAGSNGVRMLIYDNGAGSVQAGFGIDLSGTPRELAIFHPTSDGNNGDISFGKRLESSGAYTEAMRITGTGNVGIGTLDTKGYKFAVNGSAIFTKVVVKAYNNWPDYVFQASYRLRPLSEVEQYIKQYHHLPEVPSAEEVEENGIDVGENQVILIKKIEELTLYAIEQQKLLKEMDQQIKTLQHENVKLKKLIQQK